MWGFEATKFPDRWFHVGLHQDAMGALVKSVSVYYYLDQLYACHGMLSKLQENARTGLLIISNTSH